jgi:3-oxoacyl-[acyl-carrier protein] reductase
MNILVTGVSKGVGLEICNVLLREGHCVFGISRTETDGINVLKRSFSNNFHFLSFDLENTSLVQKEIFKAFIPNNIPLHGFVNNAAKAYDDIITNLNEGSLKSMFNVNVFTPMLITKYAIRNMILNKLNGSIIHLSSISVHTGYKGLSMYAGSKGALEAFSRNTSREWGEKGIRSNCIVAGFMDTDMSSTLTDEQKTRIYNRTSLKQPTDINSVAETISFLLSGKAKSITGQNIFVDNGTI